MKNIYDLLFTELQSFFEEKRLPKFHAEQIFDWLYKKRVDDFFEMKNIKKDLQEELKELFKTNFIKLVEKKEAKDVKKYLIELEDKNLIEAVLLKQNYGNSLCISTQVGCNMDCLFCESGKLKKIRNLDSFEMVQQILLVEKEEKIRVSHVVVMGIGEPFDNYQSVIKFINTINHPKGLAIGARHITVSTCGIVPKIDQFANEGLQVNLAISLNAANDKTRTMLMPINKVYNLESLIKSVKKYIRKTNRRVTFEYILLKGINDREEDALALVKLIRGINCYVNLIPYNQTNNSKLVATSKEQIMQFYDIMKKNKINVTIRKELGTNIFAACGQLKSKYEEEK